MTANKINELRSHLLEMETEENSACMQTYHRMERRLLYINQLVQEALKMIDTPDNPDQ